VSSKCLDSGGATSSSQLVDTRRCVGRHSSAAASFRVARAASGFFLQILDHLALVLVQAAGERRQVAQALGRDCALFSKKQHALFLLPFYRWIISPTEYRESPHAFRGGERRSPNYRPVSSRSVSVPAPSSLTEDAMPALTARGDVDAVYVKMAKRIIRFLALLFVMAWLDRYNLGFAKPQMVKDLGFSEAVDGFGADIVYLGYALFEVPSNLLLERIGARKTFARIAILWGITIIATVPVKTAMWFYILRFPAGLVRGRPASRCGPLSDVLVPGTPLRADAGLFMTSVPISVIVGGPISGWIMGSMGGRAGLANRQWLLLLKGVPSIAVGLLALAIVVDKPGACWLTEREKQACPRRSRGGPPQGRSPPARIRRCAEAPPVVAPSRHLLRCHQYHCDDRILGSHDHPRFGREEQHHDRPAVRRALYRRLDRDGAGRPAFGPHA
jgi:hypothetical protein